MTGPAIFDMFLMNLKPTVKEILIKLGFNDDKQIIESFMQKLIGIGECGETLNELNNWDKLTAHEKDEIVKASLDWIGQYHHNHFSQRFGFKKVQALLEIFQLNKRISQLTPPKQIEQLEELKFSLQNTETITKDSLLSFIDYRLSNKKKPINRKKPELPSFEELFHDKGKAQLVKSILDFDGITKNGKWIGQSNNLSESITAFYVLKPLIKNKYHKAPFTKVFDKEFGIAEDNVTDRTRRNNPINEDSDYYNELFSQLINKS